jgi:sec-independent protein translocase protein TatA
MEFPMHWLIIAVIVLILFGGRKIPELMRGMGEGVAALRKKRMSGNQARKGAATSAQPASSEKPADEKPQS